MKKIALIVSALAFAIGVNAASIDWAYTGESADKGYTVYLFNAIESNYETFEAFKAASVMNVGVTEQGGRTKIYTTGQQTYTEGAEIGDKMYFALISGGEAKEFLYGSLATSGLTYDSGKQQTSPGFLDVQKSTLSSAGTIGAVTPPGPVTPDVPEPTSGLLLVLGGAALALRRRR